MIRLYSKLSNFFYQDVSKNNNCVLNTTDTYDESILDVSNRQLVIICDANQFYDTNEYVSSEDDSSYTPTKKKLLFNNNLNNSVITITNENINDISNDIINDIINDVTNDVIKKKNIIDCIISEPSDSSFSNDDFNDGHINDNDDDDIYNSYTNKISWIYNDSVLANNVHKIKYKKLSYNDVKRHVNKYYDLDFTQRYSSALDILSSYLRGQKIIYNQARNYTINMLY